MKKITIFFAIIIFIFVLSGCYQPKVEPIDEVQLKESNIDNTEETLQKMVNQGGDASTKVVLGSVKLVKVVSGSEIRDMLEELSPLFSTCLNYMLISDSVQNDFLSKALNYLKTINYVQNLFNFDISSFQQTLISLSSKFNEVNKYLNSILVLNEIEGFTKLNLFPNQFDWDGDGIVEGNEELEIYLTYENSQDQERTAYIKIITGDISQYDIKEVKGIGISTNGGDAIYPCQENPMTFNENEYIEFGDVELLLNVALVTNIAEAVIDALTIYDLDSQNLIDFIYNIIAGVITEENIFEEIMEEIDTNEDGELSREEINTFLGNNFLTYLSGGDQRLLNLRNLVFEDIYALMDKNENVPEEYPDAIEEMKPYFYTEVFETGETFTEFGMEEEWKIHFYNLFDNSDNYSDLKDYMPSCPDLEYFHLIFPDPIFGGLFENFPGEIMQTPVVQRVLLFLMTTDLELDLSANPTGQIQTMVNPSDATINYMSMNEDIATVDSNGLVTGVSPGSTYIQVQGIKDGYAPSEIMYVDINVQN